MAVVELYTYNTPGIHNAAECVRAWWSRILVRVIGSWTDTGSHRKPFQHAHHLSVELHSFLLSLEKQTMCNLI